MLDETLHLTLCFLGERPGRRRSTTLAARSPRAPAQRVGELRWARPLWLPPRRPRALAVEIRRPQGGELAHLQRELSAAAGAARRLGPRAPALPGPPDGRAHARAARRRAGGSCRRRRPLRFTPRRSPCTAPGLTRRGAYEALTTQRSSRGWLSGRRDHENSVRGSAINCRPPTRPGGARPCP